MLNVPFTAFSRLELSTAGWHGAAMDDKSTPKAGGFILAVSIIAGAVGGTVAGQATVGFLVGLGAGVLLALLIWWKDRG